MHEPAPAPATVAVTPQQPPQTIGSPGEERNRDGWVSHGGTPLPMRADKTTPPPRKLDRQRAPKQKQPITAVDFSNERANVVSNTRTAADTATIFPIETSLQSLKVSLDDGRGNARTISFPTVSFGQQRVLTTGNQFAPKDGVW
jgi:hypothetical protein